MEMNFYENEATVTAAMEDKDAAGNRRVRHAKLGRGREGGVESQPGGQFRVLSTVSAVCLGLLCVLLLAGILGLWFYHSEERAQWETGQKELLTSNSNLTKERDQFKNNYNNLTKENNQLKNSYNNLNEERDQMKASYNTLITRNAQLINLFSRGFREFGGSFYYISTEEKTFEASRQDCQSRGADMVIIDNPNELQFLKGLNIKTWIGLMDHSSNSNRNFIWVDGSSLTTGYWKKGEPNNYIGYDERCVEFDATQADIKKSWNDLNCGRSRQYVCEDMFKLL